jgi:putative endonuclease
MYYVYIIECVDATLYTGITTDVARRFAEHKAGKGGHYTRAHPVKRVLYSEPAATRSAALKREAEIKKWPREKKMGLATTKTAKISRATARGRRRTRNNSA